MCWAHYKRWHRYGHPLAAAPPRPTAVERIMERTTTSEVGCWVYDGADRPRVVDANGKVRSVALILLEHEHGPKPRRTRFHSLCGVSSCVRPDHRVLREVPLSAASVAA